MSLTYTEMLAMSAEQLTKVALDHPKFAVRQKAITAIYHAGLREGIAIANAATARSDERLAASRTSMIRGFSQHSDPSVSVTRVQVGAA